MRSTEAAQLLVENYFQSRGRRLCRFHNFWKGLAPSFPHRKFQYNRYNKLAFTRRIRNRQCYVVCTASSAAVVAVSTTAAKVLGLAREAAFAACFGVGAVAESHTYASLLPSLAAVLLGGVNGAFHSATATVSAKRDPAERALLLAAVWARIGPVLAAVSCALALGAELVVDITAPGLDQHVRSLSAMQLRLMAPTVWLAGRVGLGFGNLTAGGNFIIPSASSALASLTMLTALAAYAICPVAPGPDHLLGSALVAVAVPAGSLAQWGVQLLVREDDAKPLAKDSHRHHPEWWLECKQSATELEKAIVSGRKEVMKLLVPAAVSMGVLQLGVFTDTYFASFIPGAAAAMGYANLLAMAPIGVLSSAILMPMLPAFSRLSQHPAKLRHEVQHAVALSLGLSALLAGWLAGLAQPIVEAAYMRSAFGSEASAATAELLLCYAVGCIAYLARDVYVRAFYAVGDSKTPLQISIAAIVLNAVLDWLCTGLLGLGAAGLVLSTAAVTAMSAVALAVMFKAATSNGVQQSARTHIALLKSLAAAGTTALAGKLSHQAVAGVVQCLEVTQPGWLLAARLMALGVCSLCSLGAFAATCAVLRFSEMEEAGVEGWRLLQTVYGAVTGPRTP